MQEIKHDIYSFSYTDSDGVKRSHIIESQDFTWTMLLNEYVRFLEGVFQYEIMDKISIEAAEWHKNCSEFEIPMLSGWWGKFHPAEDSEDDYVHDPYWEEYIDESFGGTDGHQIVHRLDRRRAGVLLDQLQRRGRSLFQGGSGMEHQSVIDRNARLTQSPAVALDAFLGPRRMGRAGEERDPTVAQRDQVARRGLGGGQIVGLDIDEPVAERSAVPEQHRRDALLEQVVVDGHRRPHAINRRDEDPVHATGHEATDHCIFALGLAQGMRQEQVESPLVGLVFERKQHPGIDRIGRCGDHQPQQPGLAIPQTAGRDIRNIAHLLGEGLDPGLGARRQVGLVAQRLGHRHDRDPSHRSDVLQSYHKRMLPPMIPPRRTPPIGGGSGDAGR